MEYTRHIDSHKQITDEFSLQPLTQVGSVEQYRETAKRVGKFTYVISGNDIGLNKPVTDEQKKLEQQDGHRQSYLLNGNPVSWKNVPATLKPHLNQKTSAAGWIAVMHHFANNPKLNLIVSPAEGDTRAKGLQLKDNHVWKIESKGDQLTATFHKTQLITDISDPFHKKAIVAVHYEVKLDPTNNQYSVTLHPPIEVKKSTYYYKVNNKAPIERQLSPVFQSPPRAKNLETYKSNIQGLPPIQVKQALAKPREDAKKEFDKDFGRATFVVKKGTYTRRFGKIKEGDSTKKQQKQELVDLVRSLAPNNEEVVESFLYNHAYQSNFFDALNIASKIYVNTKGNITPIHKLENQPTPPIQLTVEPHPTENHILVTLNGEFTLFKSDTQTIIGKVSYRVILDPITKSTLVELDPPKLHQAKAPQKPRIITQKQHHSLTTKICSLFIAFMALLSELFTSHKSLSDYNFSVIA